MDPVIPEGGYFIMANWSQLGKDALNQMPVLQEIITNQKSCKVIFLFSILADKVDLSSESDAQKDFKFAKWLSKNKKLQGIPPSAFFSKDHKSIGEPYIRFCFIKVGLIEQQSVQLTNITLVLDMFVLICSF